MGSYINRENLRSDSLTKDVLIVYAEGLACNTIDNFLNNDRRYAQNT